jgi:hypothetical protein
MTKGGPSERVLAQTDLEYRFYAGSVYRHSIMYVVHLHIFLPPVAMVNF